MEIDRNFLASALTAGGGSMRCYFDQQTGNVETDDMLDSDADDDRYIEVVPLPSSEGYNFRVAFAASVEDRRLRDGLEKALQGKKGVFRRFLDVVRDHPQLETQWFKAEAEWLDALVTDWLEEHGIVAEPPGTQDSSPHGQEPFGAQHAD